MHGATFDFVGVGIRAPEIGARELCAVAVEGPVRAGWRERLTHPVCLGIAAAIHLGVLAMMWPGPWDIAGDGGNATDAIAVSVVEQVPVRAVPLSAPPEAVGERIEPLVDAPTPVKPEKLESKPASPPETALPLSREEELSLDAVTLPVEAPEPRLEKQPESAVEPPRDLEHITQEAAETSPSAAAPMPAMTAAEASPAAVKAYGLQISKLLETVSRAAKV